MNIENMTHLIVEAEPRYWEDTYVDGEEDTNGTLIPCRKGNLWLPIIRLKDGFIENWTLGVSADIHYKVCDQGEYFLSNDKVTKVFKWKGYYVPDDFLAKSDGYGDYIIFTVNSNGFIENWSEFKFKLSDEEWSEV